MSAQNEFFPYANQNDEPAKSPGSGLAAKFQRILDQTRAATEDLREYPLAYTLSLTWMALKMAGNAVAVVIASFFIGLILFGMCVMIAAMVYHLDHHPQIFEPSDPPALSLDPGARPSVNFFRSAVEVNHAL